MKLSLFSNLKNPVYFLSMLGFSVLFFDIQYYLMQNLPGESDFMCVVGGNFTTANLIFSAVISLMTGIMIVGLMALYKQRKKKLAAGSLSAVALLVGSFTIFCTACTLPLISVFGLSLGLGFFTSYNLYLKIASLVLMILALFLVNRQLSESCKICKAGECKIN